jgi:hypothetical protein
MKKLLVLVVVLAIAGAAAGWLLLRSTPERSVCTRTWELCGVGEGKLEELERCVQDVEKLRQKSDDETFKRTVKCVEQANTCPGAMGCLAGGAFDDAKRAFGDFVEGFKKTSDR